MPMYPLMSGMYHSIDLQQIERTILALPKQTDDGNVHMAYSQFAAIKDDCFADAIKDINLSIGEQFTPTSVMANVLLPKTFSPVHTDSFPDDVALFRFHLAIATNPQCWWWDEINGVIHLAKGNWLGPMPITQKHMVANLGDTPRIHLIVDLVATGLEKWRQIQHTIR